MRCVREVPLTAGCAGEAVGLGLPFWAGLADEEVALLGAGAVALFEPPTAGAAGEYKGAADAAGSDGGAAADGAPTLM
eukprot:scaffold211650_cov24-Tisochrysis_lutea.AAC.1